MKPNNVIDRTKVGVPTNSVTYNQSSITYNSSSTYYGLPNPGIDQPPQNSAMTSFKPSMIGVS